MAAKFIGVDASSTSITLVVYDFDQNCLISKKQIDMDELGNSLGVKLVKGMVSGPDNYYAVPGKVLAAGAQRIMQMAADDKAFSNEEVLGMSFSVQGHLTAYLKKGIVDVLRNPSLNETLDKQIHEFFTCDCPTWMNKSTVKESRRLNEQIKAKGLNVITVAERYPAPQILSRVGTSAYDDADLIIVGNAFFPFFITGVPTFSGPGDAAASGFVNLETLTLDQEAMALVADDLHQKIIEVTPSGTLIGKASPFFQAMGYTNLEVFTSDQDNIKSGAYLIFGPQIGQVSLGTSYTVSVLSKDPIPGFEGNFGSNDKEYPFLPLLCKNNGANSIERTLETYGFQRNDFKMVSEALTRTGSGNNRAMALPWFEPEIMPYAPDANGIVRQGYGKQDFETDIRAVVEGNAASMKIWADHYFKAILDGDFEGISFAGGTTNNPQVLQVWADMFGVPGYCMYQAEDATAIGAALTAAADYFSQHSDPEMTLQKVVTRFLEANKPYIVQPNTDAATDYKKSFIPAYREFEARHAQQRL